MGAWIPKGSLKGPQGERGPQGQQGSRGETGPHGPTGPTGPKGAQGTRGSQWYTGTAVTGTSTTPTAFPGTGIAAALVGDIYLNTSTGNVYHCTTAGAAAIAKWAYVGCIRGPQGPQGSQGATGATGPVGPQGKAGATGPQGPQGPKGDPTTVDAALSETSTNPVQNKVVATKFQDVQDSLGHAGRLFSGDLGRLSIDGAGHIKLWTTAEFKEKFGAEPKDCFISVSNRASGGSGIFLASPRWNGDAVFTTQMSVQDGVVKAVPGVSQATTPVAYFVAVY